MQHGIIIRTPSHELLYSRIVLLLLLPVAIASAQTFRGTILGTVTDPNGA